jgi:hypothetical protein
VTAGRSVFPEAGRWAPWEIFSQVTGVRDSPGTLHHPSDPRSLWRDEPGDGPVNVLGLQHLTKPTSEGGFVLSESTLRGSVKVTSAVAAVLAFSLAGAGSALADTIGGGASGGGGASFGSNGPSQPSPPPPGQASGSGRTSLGAETPAGSAGGGVSAGLGVDPNLPSLPPPPAPPRPSASASAGTDIGAGTPIGSADGGLSAGLGVDPNLPALPPPPPPPQPSLSGSASVGGGLGS